MGVLACNLDSFKIKVIINLVEIIQMLKIGYYLFFLFIAIPTISAQQATIMGGVTGSNGEPLIGANIIIESTTTGTATDLDGRYRLTNLRSGDYTLIFSYVGYQSQKISVSISAGESKELNVRLLPSFDMPQIELIGSRAQRLDRVPGSASVVTQQQIMQVSAISGHEVFRQIPGVHAVEEEGIGLRANIGIRGLDPSKSRSVLMLEDGIPIALAPYGEPEMYYTPAMDRMAGVELVKGSGSILFGPQTFGGVINYITADPPPVPTATLQFRGGESGFFTGQVGYGNTIGNTGFKVNYLRKQGEGIGLLDYTVNDLTGKFKLVATDRSVIGVKLGLYDETSNSTYVGLTQAMYDAGGFDFVHLSPDDLLNVRRYSGSVTHNYFVNDNITLSTTAFGYTTTRNWSRQDFDNVFNPDREYIRIVGNPDIPGGAIFFRDQTGNRNRQFEVAGIEPRLSVNYKIGKVYNELDTGFRYLYERAFEQRINGDILSPQSGLLRDDEIRTGHAFSKFVQNAFNFTDKLSVTPGIRLEYFEYTRDIRRLSNVNVNIKNTDESIELLPGIGFNYLLNDGIAFYGGIHRGYGPPRVKDAISAEGISEELDAEKSWNYEIGTRARISNGFNFELTGFFLDFSNQIIPVSEAAGGAGRPGASLTNGGATRHSGVEASFSLNLQRMLQTTYGIDIRANATYVNAEFSEDRFVSHQGESINVKGNTVPYAPELLLSTTVAVQTPFDFGLSLTGTYIGKQFGDALNLETGSLNGRQGPIEAHFVIDARATYNLPVVDNAVVSLSVKNLLDERYIVSRRPQGIRVGLPRFISAGIDWKF